MAFNPIIHQRVQFVLDSVLENWKPTLKYMGFVPSRIQVVWKLSSPPLSLIARKGTL